MFQGCLLDWKSGRLNRVRRSTLAAETYGVSDASSAGQWQRSLLDELVTGTLLRPSRSEVSSRRVLLVTDAKSVYDHLSNEKGCASADRRISLESNLLREELELDNLKLFWVPTTHTLADCLTKEVTVGGDRYRYLVRGLEEGMYTLGPDYRSPKDSRGRTIAQTYEEAKEKLGVFSLTNEIGTQPVGLAHVDDVFIMMAKPECGMLCPETEPRTWQMQRNVYGLSESSASWMNGAEVCTTKKV